ncbi:MAG: hypothetical protein COC24_001245 [Alphaproteobacteria bacterium]|nr:hypothetical protein [Alphaproteobacteria bacterium]
MKFILNQPPHNLEISSYRILDKQVDDLVGEGRYDEALDLLNQMKQTMPDRNAENYGYCAWVYNKLNQPDKEMAELLEAAGKNIFFPMHNEGYYQGIKQLPAFAALRQQAEQALNKLRKNTESELKLYMPTARFNGEILLILHGDGQLNESIAELWPASPYLASGFAVAYLQSPQLFCTDGYFWTGHYPQNRQVIKQAFELIKQHINIDENNVTLAGFSGGAMVSISAITHGIVQPKQVLAFMPHEGDFVGNVTCKDIPTTIFRAEFDTGIEVPLAALEPLTPTKEIFLKGFDHTLPEDIASYVLPYLQQPN